MLMDALRPARLHFGWRVIAEVVQFMELRQKQSADLSVASCTRPGDLREGPAEAAGRRLPALS